MEPIESEVEQDKLRELMSMGDCRCLSCNQILVLRTAATILSMIGHDLVVKQMSALFPDAGIGV